MQILLQLFCTTLIGLVNTKVFRVDIDKPVEYIKLGPSPVLSFTPHSNDSLLHVVSDE